MTFDDNTDREALAKVIADSATRWDVYEFDAEYDYTETARLIADELLAVLPSLGWVKADDVEYGVLIEGSERPFITGPVATDMSWRADIVENWHLVKRWNGAWIPAPAPDTTKEPTP